LHDDARVRIERHPAAAGSGTVVITFDPLLYLWPKPPFGMDFLRRQGVDVIAVQRKDEHFYQALSREVFHRAVQPQLARYTRVVAYGSSLGAYAALYYGRDLDCEAIASSPRVSVHPVFGVKTWQDKVAFAHERFDPARTPRCRAIVLYDPREAMDRRYMGGEVLPQFPTARVLRVPFAGHPVTQFLGDIGFIAPFVRAVVAGREPPLLDRRQGRLRSATYFQVMAELCARRGRLPLANELVERSLALRSSNMLAHRTRGLVKTLRRDWPEAVASLEHALQLGPDDPLTLAMLGRARKGLAGAAVDAGTRVTERSSLARRAWRWVTGRG
ncbi:hypothetical protein LDC_2463, partial [sediment metagenome]